MLFYFHRKTTKKESNLFIKVYPISDGQFENKLENDTTQCNQIGIKIK